MTDNKGGMMKVKIIERGWVGHHISGFRCLFRRNTLIEYGKKKIVVSTVGNLYNEAGHKIEEVGLDRYYETKVFWAKYEKPYWEVDVEYPIETRHKWYIEKTNRETDIKANKMHEKIVQEICERIKTLNKEVL